MKKRSDLFQYISFFIVFIIYMILLIIAQRSFGMIDKEKNLNLKLIISLIVGIIFPFIIHYLNSKYFTYIGIEPTNRITLNIKTINKIIIGFLFSLLALYISGFIFFIENNEIKYLLFKISFPLIIFNIITAIGEEIIFRGTILYFFIKKDKKYLGLIISSSIFSLIHLLNLLMGYEINISSLITLVVAGLFLGLIYINFGIISSISAHYLWNLVYAGSSFNEESSEVQIVILVLCVVLFIMERRKVIKEV